MQPSALPEKIQQALRAVDPLRRPDPFGLEAALDAALGSEQQPMEGSIALAISLAEELLQRCTSCDVMYTYNVLRLAEWALVGLGETVEVEPSDVGLRIRMHCVAASALTLHQVGDKASNLAQAGQHLRRADELDAASIDPEHLASALLNFVRAALCPNPGVSRLAKEVTTAQHYARDQILQLFGLFRLVRLSCQLSEHPSTRPLFRVSSARNHADQGHLSRIAKALTGFTPSQYRSLLRPR